MTQEKNRPSTVKQEMEAGRRNTPDFGGPTVVLTVVLFGVSFLATWAALSGGLPYWAGAAANTVVLYALYTVVHEALHGNISLRKKHLKWLDSFLGHLACVPLWLFYFQHRKQHMVHHTHTNMDDDPDIYARGGFLSWIFVRLPISLLNYFNPVALYRECLRFAVPKRQIGITFLTFAVQAGVVGWIIWAGFGYELLVLWFIPWWIGQTVMLTLFTWTPHHDHSETGRYRDTRESVFAGGSFLLLGQNHHLIHHMLPGVPWYRYAATFRDVRPYLEQNDVRIEGFWPGARGK